MTLDTRITLHDIFPTETAILHQFKLDNAHFRALAQDFDTLSKQIYRIETDIEPTSDERLEELKKKRLALLDEVAAMIAAQHEKA